VDKILSPLREVRWWASVCVILSPNSNAESTSRTAKRHCPGERGYQKLLVGICNISRGAKKDNANICISYECTREVEIKVERRVGTSAVGPVGQGPGFTFCIPQRTVISFATSSSTNPPHHGHHNGRSQDPQADQPVYESPPCPAYPLNNHAHAISD
jgi:hypothetical protein